MNIINSINYVQQNQLPKLNLLAQALWQFSLLFASRPHIIKFVRKITNKISTTPTLTSQTVYEYQLNPLTLRKTTLIYYLIHSI